MADQSFLRDHPDLRPFLLSSARATGRTIGNGSYGSVEEVAIPGAVCAAKKIHDFFLDPKQTPREGVEKATTEFVRECQLMSTLRHPHIVQFLGVCFPPGSRMPALVMEKLATGLHDILDPEPEPPTKPFIPVSLKCSILHDVARGLSFLHSHSPPIIHRDLSARNVLLNEGMVAKIADLGMARIVPSLRASTMTKTPGASIYMPPEALEDKSKYDITIDIFSFGVLAIFTFSQMFPNPLAAAYIGVNRKIMGRTELERRGNYMREVRRQFQEGHPLVKMIQQCLSNVLEERPTIQQVMGWLEEARAEVEDGEYDMNKLSLAQLLQSRNLHIEQYQRDNRSLREIIQQQRQKNHRLRKQNNNLIEQSHALKKHHDVRRAELEEKNQLLQLRNLQIQQQQQQEIQQQQEEICSLKEDFQQQQIKIDQKEQKIHSLREEKEEMECRNLHMQQEIHQKELEINDKDAQIKALEEAQMFHQRENGEEKCIVQDQDDVQKLKEENKELRAGNITKLKVFYVSFAVFGLFLSLLLFQFVSQFSFFCIVLSGTL